MGTQNPSRTYAMGLTLLSALGRLVPHAPNFTPVGSSCLFAGSRIGGYLAYLLPLVVMIATDPFVGGYTFGSPLIYASFMINVWIGRRLVREVSVARVGGAALLCSTQFFIISNFGVWLAATRSAHPYYQPNLAGLVECYISAIPYWGYTVAGDVFYSAALFGMYAFLSRRLSQTAEHSVA